MPYGVLCCVSSFVGGQEGVSVIVNNKRSAQAEGPLSPNPPRNPPTDKQERIHKSEAAVAEKELQGCTFYPSIPPKLPVPPSSPHTAAAPAAPRCVCLFFRPTT